MTQHRIETVPPQLWRLLPGCIITGCVVLATRMVHAALLIKQDRFDGR